MVFANAILKQMVSEKSSQKIRLSTSPDPCNDFDQSISLATDQLFKIMITLDFHYNFTSLKDIFAFFYTNILYDMRVIRNILKDIFAYFYINILLIHEFEYINSLTAMNRPAFLFL